MKHIMGVRISFENLKFIDNFSETKDKGSWTGLYHNVTYDSNSIISTSDVFKTYIVNNRQLRKRWRTRGCLTFM